MLVILKTSFTKEISLRDLERLIDYLNSFIDKRIEQAEFIFSHKVSLDENVESMLFEFKQIIRLNELSSILTTYFVKEKASVYLEDNLSLSVYEQLLKDDSLKVFQDCASLTQKYNEEVESLNSAAEVSTTINTYLEEICVPATSIFNERMNAIAEDLKGKAETLRLKHEKLLDRKYIRLHEIINKLDWCELQHCNDGLSLEFKKMAKLPEETV